jgi:hypothetical protein
LWQTEKMDALVGNEIPITKVTFSHLLDREEETKVKYKPIKGELHLQNLFITVNGDYISFYNYILYNLISVPHAFARCYGWLHTRCTAKLSVASLIILNTLCLIKCV